MSHPGFESGNLSRRDVLKALGAAGAAGALSTKESFAQAVYKSTARGGRIDVHHHHLPPGMPPGTSPVPGKPQRAIPSLWANWTPAQTLEQMDKYNITVSILSMTQMGAILYDNTEKGRAATRFGNEYGARIMVEHPKRFGLFAGVPLPDIDGVMKEIEYGLDTLKADGIGIYTNDNQGRWPGDPYFEPMWQELNRRRAIVYMHPLPPPCCVDLNYGVGSGVVEYDFDIARACVGLLANGVLHRYPNIKIIIPHSGGTMPMLAGRIMDDYPPDPQHAEYIPNGVIPELQKFYVDIAHASYPYPLAAMLKLALPDHILFGTDYPFALIEKTADELPASGLSAKQMRAIERENAEKLFPRFRV